MGEVLTRLDAERIHELDRNWQNTRLDDVRDTLTGHLIVIEPHQNRPRAFWFT